MNPKLLLVISLMAMVAADDTCSQYKACAVCMADTRCSWVLAQISVQDESTFMCTSRKPSTKGPLIHSRTRDSANCHLTGDVPDILETKGSALYDAAGKEGRDYKPCPSITTLAIALFTTSILLAVIVSAVTTITCWVAFCANADDEERRDDVAEMRVNDKENTRAGDKATDSAVV